MENKKDIGKAFREKLDHLDKSPNEKVWRAIHADLHKKRKRRFIFIPFWMKTIGIFSLGIVFSLFVFNGSLKDTLFSKSKNENEREGKIKDASNPNILKAKPHRNILNSEASEEHAASNNKIKKSDSAAGNVEISTDLESNSTNKTAINKLTKSKSKDASESHKSNVSFKNYKKYTSEQASLKGKNAAKKHLKKRIHGNSVTEETNKSANELMEQVKAKNLEVSQDQISASKTNPLADESNSASSSEKTATEEKPVITATDSLKNKTNLPLKEPLKKEKDSTKVIEMNRINLFVFASPTSIGLLSKKSPFDTSLNSNLTKSELSWSYGAYVSYETTSKWSLRFGFVKTTTKLITVNAPVTTTSEFENINYTHFSNSAVYNMSNAITMDIVQEVSYTEVPLELKYAIIDKKFGLNAYGGISLKFLEKNKVFARTPNGQTYELGETKNMSSSSYSINAGLGFDYKFTRRLRFNIEPLFKFNLFDYKSLGKMKVYTVGVLSGLQFSLQK